MRNGDPDVPQLPSVLGYSLATLSPGSINKEAWSSRWGVGHETNLPCKNVENFPRKKILEEAKAHL
jgi:hypothetical protein